MKTLVAKSVERKKIVLREDKESKMTAIINFDGSGTVVLEVKKVSGWVEMARKELPAEDMRRYYF